MPLINTAVPNLIQGVSQQSDATRFAGQCEEQENALSSVADGLKKRPNTRHVGKLLSSAIDSNSFVHFINRSGTEKYVIIHDGTYLCAYSLIDGSEQSITFGGTEYKSTNSNGKYPISGTYLSSDTARASLKALTIADSTFLLNTEVAIGLGTDNSPSVAKKALLFIKQGDYKKKYGFKVRATLASNSGTLATLTFSSSLSNTRYMQERAYINNITVPSGGSGSGFAVNDIINIPLPSTSIVDTYNDDDDDFTYNTTLTIYTQPTMRVTQIGTNGVITGASVENAGSFIYRDGTHQGFGLGSGPFNEGNNGNPAAGSKALNIPTTNSTPVTTSGTSNRVNLQKVFQSGDSSGNNASQNTSSSTILTGVTALNTTSGSHAGTTSNLGSYFETENHVVSNLLILSVKQSNGIDLVEDFTISPIDDLSGGGMGVVYKEVNSITDLPLVAKNGFEVKVAGDAELNQDDYYVRFETTGGEDVGQGSWIECVAPELRLGYDTNTLPMELISDGIGFTLRTMKFADRVAGNEDSNPLASFVAQTIENLFFFKNRLGFLSGENVIMSESGLGVLDTTGQLNFNFGRTTVTTLLDSDPIDVSVASSRVTNLKSAKGFQENLVLFSENGQFVLKGGDVLTPKTVSITPVTNFNFEDQVDPLPLGSYIYFPFTRGNFTGLREFTVNATTDVYDSTEVTEHVPAYIPKNIIDMAGTTSEDMIALLSGDEKSSLYIYNYFWSNNQKVLSAWSKFTFTGEIRGIEFVESTLHVVITNGTETNLVEMPLESGLKDAAGFVTHLDMRVASTVTNGASTITLPYTPADNSVEVYTTDGLKLTCTNSGAAVTLAQAVSTDTPVFVGIPYTMKYTFSEQLFKAKAGQGSSPSNAAKLLVRNGSIYFDNTAFFRVKVTPKHRDTSENVFTPDIVGSSTLGSLDLDSGFYRFPVFTKAQDTTITIENESALPSNFQSAEFESFLHSRSNRYG